MLKNKAFLSKLYSENRKNILRFINSQIYSKNIDDVEDCVQEVFLVAVRKSQSVDIENHPNIKGWLFLIAKNIVSRFNRAYIKANHAMDAESDINLLVEEDFTNQMIEDIIYEAVDKEKLMNDLTENLSENDKILFMMKRKGKSNKEISVIFNISENAVASRYKRLRQKLKKLYEKVTPL